jgi:hypothetical protein
MTGVALSQREQANAIWFGDESPAARRLFDIRPKTKLEYRLLTYH